MQDVFRVREGNEEHVALIFVFALGRVDCQRKMVEKLSSSLCANVIPVNL